MESFNERERKRGENGRECEATEEEEDGRENRIGSPITHKTQSDAFVTRTRERRRKNELYGKDGKLLAAITKGDGDCDQSKRRR